MVELKTPWDWPGFDMVNLGTSVSDMFQCALFVADTGTPDEIASFEDSFNTARSEETIRKQFGFASWMHFLRFRKDARIWQNKSADTILADVFGMHPQARGAFRFVLKNLLPSRSFCMQYEDDWNFVHRLMESEGLFSYFEQADDGKSHTLVITDDLYSMPTLGQTIPFYRAGTNSETDALVQWSGMRTLQSTTLATRTFDYKSPGSPANPKPDRGDERGRRNDLMGRQSPYRCGMARGRHTCSRTEPNPRHPD
jgi:uncharacterized protein involved in type VI secretion and phage assembly